MRRIYMDANATTPLLPEVFEAMRPFWTERFGNASSVHQQGRWARGAVEQARMSVARLVNCQASEIVFTSGGTESDNLAIFGTLRPTPGDRLHLITSSIEHHAVLHAAEALAADPSANVDLTVLPCTPEGCIDPAALEAALRPNTRLVSIMLANNETGVIQPVRRLAEIAHAAGALFHTDAIQVAGKLPLDVNELGCDLLSLSGHKMYGPQGTGALFVRRNIRLSPQLHGGTHERQRRAGTENVPGIVGLGRAAELGRQWLAEDRPDDGPTRLAALRDRLEQGLLNRIAGCGINGGCDAVESTAAPARRVPNTTNAFFEAVEAESLVIALDLKGLSVSGGSACQSGATEPSHVLTAMGLTPAHARGSIRVSLSRHTSEQDVDEALDLIATAVGRLRSISPAQQKLSA